MFSMQSVSLNPVIATFQLSSGVSLNLGWSQYGVLGNGLTHYQTTNFRLFQTEKVSRRQFQISRKWQKVIQTGRKHWEKEKLLVTSNFSFSHSVFERLVSQGRQKVSLCGNGLNDQDHLKSL